MTSSASTTESPRKEQLKSELTADLAKLGTLLCQDLPKLVHGDRATTATAAARTQRLEKTKIIAEAGNTLRSIREKFRSLQELQELYYVADDAGNLKDIEDFLSHPTMRRIEASTTAASATPVPSHRGTSSRTQIQYKTPNRFSRWRNSKPQVRCVPEFVKVTGTSNHYSCREVEGVDDGYGELGKTPDASRSTRSFTILSECNDAKFQRTERGGELSACNLIMKS